MKVISYLILFVLFVLPLNLDAGIVPFFDNTDKADFSISGPYDLRDRSSHIQITNVLDSTITIHVQIFQHDRECDELNFDDTLTAKDTVVYDLDNIIKNDGTEVPVNLLEDSNGYVVITVDEGGGMFRFTTMGPRPIVGNFRIIDISGYEYRSNLVGIDGSFIGGSTADLYANFNTVDEANLSDVIGYVILYDGMPMNETSSTVQNYDTGLDFDIFVFDMDEEPLSCDRRNFACGNIMNYGINEDYPNSRGDDLLCPGGGLADPAGGFVSFSTNIPIILPPPFNADIRDFIAFHGFIGINNGDGTGSMDIWLIDNEEGGICG